MYIAFHGILVHVFSMVHVYNEVANQIHKEGSH